MRHLAFCLLVLGIASCPGGEGGGNSGSNPSALAVDAGGSHTCALAYENRAFCWGDGSHGQLGYGNTSDRSSPGESIPGLEDVRQISAGGFHTCALVANGSVHCWGSGGNGQLGYGNTSDRSSPGEAIPGLVNVSQISAGSNHTCAVLINGNAHCWGLGSNGILGYGVVTGRNAPGGPIPDFGNVTRISAGISHTCALVANGSAHCWGWGFRGRLGYGDSTSRTAPGEAIPGLESVSQVSAGSGSHTCALAANGSAHCWGSGINGRLGYGDASDRNSPGSAIAGFGNAIQISVGRSHTCALVANGSVHCWGLGSNGPLGYGGISSRSAPGDAIPGFGNVTQISAGDFHTCAVSAGVRVYCWGLGSDGRLGYGDTFNRFGPSEPVPYSNFSR